MHGAVIEVQHTLRAWNRDRAPLWEQGAFCTTIDANPTRNHARDVTKATASPPPKDGTTGTDRISSGEGSPHKKAEVLLPAETLPGLGLTGSSLFPGQLR